MENEDVKTIRCTRCSEEFSDKESEGLTCCSKCGDTGVPMLIADDVTVKVNWHELRILGIWAENWAKKIQDDNKDDKRDYLLTVMCIAERLQKQYPDKTPLTLFSEIRQLRKDVEQDEVKIITDIDSDEKLGL